MKIEDIGKLTKVLIVCDNMEEYIKVLKVLQEKAQEYLDEYASGKCINNTYSLIESLRDKFGMLIDHCEVFVDCIDSVNLELNWAEIHESLENIRKW